MIRHPLRGAALLLGLMWVACARAEPLPAAQLEISFLLGYVEGSGCAFYRNGTAYDSKAAQLHLREKYKYLVARNLIATTEDFIEKAATVSSFTDQPYGVKCNGAASIASGLWLREELARLRTYQTGTSVIRD